MRIYLKPSILVGISLSTELIFKFSACIFPKMQVFLFIFIVLYKENIAISIERYQMFQLLKCLFGLHGVTEIHYCADGEIEVCRNCLKVKDVK